MNIQAEKIRTAFRRSLDATLSERSAERSATMVEAGMLIDAARKIGTETGIAFSHALSVLMGLAERPGPDPSAALEIFTSWTDPQQDCAWIADGMGRILSSASFGVFVRETCKVATSAREALNLADLEEDDFVTIIEGISDQRVYGAIAATLCMMKSNGHHAGIGSSSTDILDTLDKAWRGREVDTWISEIATLPPYEMERMTTVTAAALLGLTLSAKGSGRLSLFSAERGEPIKHNEVLPSISSRFPERDFTTNHGSLWRRTDKGVPLAVASSRGGGMTARYWVRQIALADDKDLLGFPDLAAPIKNHVETLRDETWLIGIGAHCDCVTPLFGARIVRDSSFAEMHMVHMRATQHSCPEDPLVLESQETLGMLMGEQIYDDMVLRAQIENENIIAVPVDEHGDVIYAEGLSSHALGVIAALAGPIEGTHVHVGWHDGQGRRFDCHPGIQGPPSEINIVDMELQQDPWGAVMIVQNGTHAVRRLEKPTASDQESYLEAVHAVKSEIPSEIVLPDEDIERYAAVTYAVHPDPTCLGAVAAWLDSHANNVAVIHVIGDLLDVQADSCKPWEGVSAAVTRLLTKESSDGVWFERVCNTIDPNWREA